jgi:hypothetical protein
MSGTPTNKEWKLNMAAPQRTIDQFVILRNVSWETFERLLADHEDCEWARAQLKSKDQR